MGRLVKIRVKDLVDTVYSNDDGKVVYSEVKKQLQENNKVAVSFDTIGALNTSFVNSAFIELLKDYDFNYIKNHIQFIDSTNQINQMIKSRFSFEVNNTKVYH
ncbi:STAS-like domain-containing protein [Bacillus weihaiensis]|uniref:STAS-like domain-containing protein n=1 Tax=Bacillus weihaiensis TaxID=1547283 RepID=UPI002357AA4C|nr:STAS-like domain-containing protein [Bacillus weihaiensis]